MPPAAGADPNICTRRQGRRTLTLSTIRLNLSRLVLEFCYGLSLKHHPTHPTKGASGAAQKWTSVRPCLQHHVVGSGHGALDEKREPKHRAGGRRRRRQRRPQRHEYPHVVGPQVGI